MKALIVATLAMASFAASAAHLEATTSTCKDLQDAVNRNGWQIIQVNGQPAGNKAAYAVYYSYNNIGDINHQDYIPVMGFVPTADVAHCPVGYIGLAKSSLGLSK